jgi:hypothetical protein
LSDLIRNGLKINKREVERSAGLVFENGLWRKLDNIRLTALTRFGNNSKNNSQSLKNFVEKWKRGSKKVRNILSLQQKEYIPHNMIKFAENTEIIINAEVSKELNMLWCKNFLSNATRVFTFNMHNNTLPVNIILTHFVRDIGRNCTFCDLSLNPEEEPETVLHLFVNCRSVETLRTELFKWITGDNRFEVTRSEFFSTFRRGNRYLNELLQLVALFFKKYLWDTRARKKLLAVEEMKQYISLEIDTNYAVSGYFRNIFEKSGINEQIRHSH